MSFLLNQFWKRWKTKYLTSLRESHRSTRNNKQVVKVVLAYDDGPRANWRLAVIEDVVTGNDGLIRSVKILAEQTAQSVDCTRLRHHVRRIQSRPVNMPQMINKLQMTVIVVIVWIHKMSAPSGL